MLNIVSKNITTLPSEICDIIYQYYKLPYLDDIVNPFTKYRLLTPYWREKTMTACRETTKRFNYDKYDFKLYQTKRFNNHKYHLQFDNELPDILPRYAIKTKYDCSYGYTCKYMWRDLKDKRYRENLIQICDENRIELKPREYTKTMIKKLMKL